MTSKDWLVLANKVKLARVIYAEETTEQRKQELVKVLREYCDALERHTPNLPLLF